MQLPSLLADGCLLGSHLAGARRQSALHRCIPLLGIMAAVVYDWLQCFLATISCVIYTSMGCPRPVCAPALRTPLLCMHFGAGFRIDKGQTPRTSLMMIYTAGGSWNETVVRKHVKEHGGVCSGNAAAM